MYGLYREELQKHPQTKRMFQHAKSHHVSSGGQIVDAISIRNRPPEIEDRAVPGHWKGDLIIGSHNSAIATVAERHSRLTVLFKLESRKTTSVVGFLTEQMKRLPKQVLTSLTWNRGREMCAHKRLSRWQPTRLYVNVILVALGSVDPVRILMDY